MKENEKNHEAKPLLSIPPEAQKIHGSIVEILRQIRETAYPDCINDDFTVKYRHAMELYDEFQRASVAASGDALSCGPGCWICCCHYPEDVYSFEAEIISHHVRQLPVDQRTRIEESCEKAVYTFERLKAIVSEKLQLDEFKTVTEESDPFDILLNSYYQLKNRCPFLDEENMCVIYAIRPLTCRAYINLGDPSVCPPEMINENDISTYILDLDDDANTILDELHFRYEKYPDDTSLCSLVLKYLSD